MSRKLIFHMLGNLLISFAGTMLLPVAVALYYQIWGGQTETDLGRLCSLRCLP